jgi:hypothetical protein
MLLVVLAGCAQKYDASKFPDWVGTDGVWRTVVATSFKDGAANAPSDAHLKTIMKLTSRTVTSGGKTDYLLVVLKDVAQQVDVVGEGKANSGTITVLVFGDRLLPKEVSLSGVNQQLDRGYYDVGIATGYLNLGAIAMGYGTHMYMTTMYTMANSPRTMSIEDAYLKDKGYMYTYGWGAPATADANKQAPAYGNLKFVCAIVIGRVDDKAETKVTDHGFPENWVIAK